MRSFATRLMGSREFGVWHLPGCRTPLPEMIDVNFRIRTSKRM
jgi:hypothetical protein